MKINFSFLLSLASYVIVSTFACCDDEIPMPPDPCLKEEPVSADFTTFETFFLDGDEHKTFEADTFIYGRTVTFSANQDLDFYEWQIGTDPTLFTSKSVSLAFEVLGEIEVTLIVDGQPNTDCFPADDGRDTITKIITLIPIEDAAIFGKYEGYREFDPSDIFTIEIARLWSENNQLFDNYLTNFPKGCHLHESQNSPNEEGIPILISNDYCRLSGSSLNFINCSAVPRGWGFLNEDHTNITLEYSIFDTIQGKRIDDKFIGTKIE